MAAEIVQLRRGRPSNTQLSDRLSASQLRNRLLRMELMAAGMEMEALGHRIELAIHNDRPDIADQVAARLIVLGRGYRQRGTA